MVHLYIYPKTEEPFSFVLEGKAVSVGRAPDNDLTLPDQFCSSRHALIAVTPEGYAVRDQGSKNGVFVNGIKILAETPLRRGDEILLGSTRIVFDEQAPTQVEMVEGPAGPANYNTMIQVRDILKRPPPDTKAVPARTPAADLEHLRREQKVLFVLNEVSQALIYHFPLDKLLDHIMDLIIQNIPMDRGVLMLKEGEPFRLVPKVVRIVDPGAPEPEHPGQPDDPQHGPGQELLDPPLGHPVGFLLQGAGERRPVERPFGHVRPDVEQRGDHRHRLRRPRLDRQRVHARTT